MKPQPPVTRTRIATPRYPPRGSTGAMRGNTVQHPWRRSSSSAATASAAGPPRCTCPRRVTTSTIADNFARRGADVELEAESLTPIRPLGVRRAAWAELTGREIGFHRIDVAKEYDMLRDLLAQLRPDAVVHFAEQRAAPYSMKSARHKRYTVDNNVNATHEPADRAGRDRARRARRPPRHDGRLRLRRRAADPRGLPDRPHGRQPGRRGRARDPLPAVAGQRLPRHEDARPAPAGVLQPQRRRPRDRPAPGHRVGHADRGDPARRAADQPLRLRRRLRHGAEPLPDAGRDRLPADRARDRRPDARVHPPPGQRALHPARDRASARAAASGSGSSTR